MADRHLLINQSGPLPLSATLTTGSNGPSTLFVSGSCWTAGGAQQIGLAVMMDGVRVGEAVIWSNESNEHRAVVPVFIPVSLDKNWPSETQPPSYQFELIALNAATNTDVNDFFQLSFVE